MIENADDSEFRDHPGNRVLGLKAYLGQPIYVDDAIWGTVCFLDTTPRAEAFTTVDLDLFELICQRVQVGIDHQSVLAGFRAVLSGTANVTGDGFFRSLVAELCRGLKVDTAFVAEHLDRGSNGVRAHTVAVWSHGALANNFEYNTGGTPSDDLRLGEVTCHADEVQRLFPDDSDLTRQNLRGWAGIGLCNRKGQSVGHLVAASGQRLDLKTHEKWLVEIFAARAGAELERVRGDEEQLRLEREMLHGEKLMSLGVLAGGIAHDFNNLLTGIVGNVGLIQMDAPAGSTLAHLVDQIETAATGAERLTKQLLAYSGRGSFIVEPMDLTACVQDVAELLDSAVSKSVTFRRSFADNLPPVETDNTQVRQVVMNLVMNASDAVAGKPGVVSLRTGLVEVSAEALREYHAGTQIGAGTFVYIEVEDDWIGMDDETQRKMFDPFFTTKGTGRGLGLSAALGIVRGQQGAIRVRSVVDEGTCVRILFPARSGAASLQPEGEGRLQSLGISGTALVVDDEEMLRNVGAAILQRSGMSVLCARDGAEAVEMFEKRHAEIVVVLLDLTMPGMDGRTAAEEIRQIDSTVPVILTSGYDKVEVTGGLHQSDRHVFLQKPFTVTSLREAVRRSVERPAVTEEPPTRSGG